MKPTFSLLCDECGYIWEHHRHNQIQGFVQGHNCKEQDDE